MYDLLNSGRPVEGAKSDTRLVDDPDDSTPGLLPLGLGDWSTPHCDLDAFVSRRDETAGRSGPHGNHLAVVLLEVDALNPASPTQNHQTRERVLKAAAAAVCLTTRTEDFPARVGTDQFALAVTYWEPEDLLRVANRVRLAFERACRSSGVDCTMSIGVAGSRQWPRHLLAELAARALESSKERGGNHIEIYKGQALPMPANES